MGAILQLRADRKEVEFGREARGAEVGGCGDRPWRQAQTKDLWRPRDRYGRLNSTRQHETRARAAEAEGARSVMGGRMESMLGSVAVESGEIKKPDRRGSGEEDSRLAPPAFRRAPVVQPNTSSHIC
jgi:hypothetical protein